MRGMPRLWKWAAGRVRGVGRRGGAAHGRPVGHGFWFGMGEALLLPLVFAGLGLSWYGALLRAEPPAASYPAPMASPASPASETWLVDGFNVVQVALLGGRDRSSWWSGPQRAELLARAEAFDRSEVPVVVVFDGSRAAPTDPTRRVQPVFAPSADEWLVDQVRRADQPDRLVVVTADRRLAGRVRHHGGRVVSPGEFLGRCPEPSAHRADSGETTTI